MAPPVEQAVELVAPESWRVIDFISDLHLADDTPRTFAAWASYLRATPADAVLILGDLFEAWVGDDASAEGFEARAAAVLADA
jgi:UDP-2,3-diacylglucosamine hydrolase